MITTMKNLTKILKIRKKLDWKLKLVYSNVRKNIGDKRKMKINAETLAGVHTHTHTQVF